MKHTKTLKLRIKDRHAKVLRQMARDVNAARNILAAGHGRLAVGIPALTAFGGKPTA